MLSITERMIYNQSLKQQMNNMTGLLLQLPFFFRSEIVMSHTSNFLLHASAKIASTYLVTSGSLIVSC